MVRKSTDELQDELMRAPDLRRFLTDNRENFVSGSFSELLREKFERTALTKAALAKRSGMSEVYLHQLFSGGRNPSRNRILCLCFGLGCSTEDTQALLRESGSAALYPRNRRDAVILYGILHGLTLDQVNDRLFQEGEETLC